LTEVRDRWGNKADGLVDWKTSTGISVGRTTDWWLYSCGHFDSRTDYGTGCYFRLDYECPACKKLRVGTTIEFIRYGKPPKHSYDHRDKHSLRGVSVYEVGHDGQPLHVGWHFEFLSRPAYRGRGEIVGWGPDGEPLVKIKEIHRLKSQDEKEGEG
jgi:hypothetical protein